MRALPFLLALGVSAASLAAPIRVRAQSVHDSTAHTVSLNAGSGRVLALPRAAASVFAAAPTIAEVRPASPTSLFVFGIAPGETTVAALDAAGRPVAQFEVVVQPSGFGAATASAGIAAAIPGSGVSVQATQAGLSLSGQVRSAADAERASSIAKGYLTGTQKLSDHLTTGSSIQVSLRVRIAEMSRSLTRELGIDWSAAASLGRYAALGVASAGAFAVPTSASAAAGYNFPTPGKIVDLNAVIDALAQDNLVHVLAEPNLTAMSGEPASFLVGGEYPIPVAQGGTSSNAITVTYQQYGVSLSFVPTVLSDGQINLRVRPEVSALTSAGAVSLQSGSGSLQIPALTVRRADTTVELGSGQSFAIAGLLQDTTTLTGNGVPFLGDLPILGALFRSDSFQRNETELVIVVTPYIVHPVSDPHALALPTDGWTPPNDLERLLLLRQSGRQRQPATEASAPARIPGDAGFIVE